MPTDPSRKFDARAAQQTAADWIARRDRGLTAAEQDDYLQWLQEDVRHAALVARHEATLERMRKLANWQPSRGGEPYPDLFAADCRRYRWVVPIAAAVAAVLVIGLFLGRKSHVVAPNRAVAHQNYLRVNERQALADGSIVQLKDGSRIDVRFSSTERRIHLSGGEAHFTVAKDPARPFIVEAGGVAVRAVGTIFNVRLDAGAVDVLVTEGRVRVESPMTPSDAVPVAPEPTLVSASQRTVVSLAPAAPEPEVVSVTPEQISDALAWQAPRLQFYETPLADAVAEFNRHNAHKLVIGDAGLGSLSIGGTFRLDNVDGFVRLLEVTLGIRGETRRAGETVLIRAR